MIYIIVGLICLAAGLLIGLKTVKVQNKKLDEALLQQEQKVRQSIADMDRLQLQKQNDYMAAAMVRQDKLNKLDTEVKVKETEMQAKVDEIKDYKFSKINRAATALRSQLYQEIQDEADKLYDDCREKIYDAQRELKVINVEIDDLKASRDALIEANKREEENRLKQDFYKIQITNADISDIKTLKSIEPHLHKKEPLYKLIWSTFYITPTKEMLNRIVGKDKTSGIYKITNQLNGKVYIGQSVDLQTRLVNHIKSSLGIGTIAHQSVHDAMAADGLENFTFEIVEKCSKEQLNKKEKLWIDTYSSDKYGYNHTAGGSTNREEK